MLINDVAQNCSIFEHFAKLSILIGDGILIVIKLPRASPDSYVWIKYVFSFSSFR